MSKESQSQDFVGYSPTKPGQMYKVVRPKGLMRIGGKVIKSPPFVDWGDLKILRWLNPPRYSPRYPDPKLAGSLRVNREQYEKQLEGLFDFNQPKSYWTMAMRFVGKSNLAQILGKLYILHGGTVIDIFSSDDNEALQWILSGFKKILLIIGNKVELKRLKPEYANIPAIHIGELKKGTPGQVRDSLRFLEQFEVVITVPGFYYNAQEMYGALSYLVDLLKERKKWKYRDPLTGKMKPKIMALIVREARELIASRFEAGQVSNKLTAENDLIELHTKAFHTGVALIFDALRYTSITPEVRDIASFTFMKRLGATAIPRNLFWALRYVRPSYLRSMPLRDWVLITDKNKVFYGVNDLLPWHVERGTDPMEIFGFDILYNPTPDKSLSNPLVKGSFGLSAGESRKVDPSQASKVQDIHHKKAIRKKIEEGLSYSKLREVMKEDPETPLDASEATWLKEIRKHNERKCSCFQSEKVTIVGDLPGHEGEPLSKQLKYANEHLKEIFDGEPQEETALS